MWKTPSRRVRGRTAILGIALALASGCADEPTRPGPGAEPDEAPKMEFGLMEITITGLSTAGEMSATARSVPREAAASHSNGSYAAAERRAASAPGLVHVR